MCKNKDEKIFKEEESIEILKSLGLIENISQQFRLKNIDRTRNYFLEEIKKNEFMSWNHKKVCITLNYIEHFLILASIITGCISISTFFNWYFYRNYELCNRIKKLCNNCRKSIIQ